MHAIFVNTNRRHSYSSHTRNLEVKQRTYTKPVRIFSNRKSHALGKINYTAHTPTLLTKIPRKDTALGLGKSELSSQPRLSPTIPKIRTRTNLPFTLRNIGMFIHSFLLTNQKNPYTYKYKFKKRMYSFVFPNEIRGAIMLRKKRITLYKLVFKTKRLPKTRKFFAFTSFNKNIISNYRMNLRNRTNLYNNYSKLFPNCDEHQAQKPYRLTYENNTTSQDELFYQKSFNSRGVDITNKRSEVRIPRIRFRPGYQRM